MYLSPEQTVWRLFKNEEVRDAIKKHYPGQCELEVLGEFVNDWIGKYNYHPNERQFVVSFRTPKDEIVE